MEFEFSQKTRMYQEQLVDFMDKHIYPNEQTFVDQLNGQSDALAGALHHGGAEGQGARARPVEPLPARERAGGRPDQPRVRPPVRDHGALSHRSRGLQLLGARHRQHGGPRPLRHARAEEAVAGAAAGRQDPLGLRHDRAQGGLLGRDQHRVRDPARRATTTSSTATSGGRRASATRAARSSSSWERPTPRTPTATSSSR